MYGSKDGAVADGTLRTAFAALDRQEYETALEQVSAVLAAEPDNATAWRVRALARWELASAGRGKVAQVREHRIEAIVAARRAVELAPGDIENLRIRARTLLVASPADALVALNKAVALDPGDPALYELIAAVRADLEEQESARRALEAERQRAAAETRWRMESETEPESGSGVGKFVIGALVFVIGFAFKLGLGFFVDEAVSDTPSTRNYPTASYKPYPTKGYPTTAPHAWPTMPPR
ncbi:hypothetical protein ABZ319_21730 [Nocardia sp. NPDC005978]|uniref:tetratricopeptide repeat protein n=1 Tax=Nocardia sp. NPDC005978 TaxID=3156725 RepID=UPI0033B32700